MAKQKCPDFETIINYLEKQLPIESVREVEQHLATCARCSTLLGEARELLEILHEDAELVVPEQAHRQAVALFRPWFQAQPKKAEGSRHLIARLVQSSGLFQDGLVLPHAPGLRALSPSGQSGRQLLFEADVREGIVEIDLQIQRTENRENFTLLGQVMGLAGTPDRVELVALGGTRFETKADETATFQFQSLVKGQYLLSIYFGSEIIEISSFDI